MAKETAFSFSDPGASYPGYDPDEPTIQNEILAYELRKNLYAMTGTSFLWQQERMDYSYLEIEPVYASMFSNWATWLASCKSAIAAEDPLPDPPNFFTEWTESEISPATWQMVRQAQIAFSSAAFAMYAGFTGKWGNYGYAGRGEHDGDMVDLLEADIAAVQAWFDSAIAAKIAGSPIPDKPTLSSPSDYEGLMSGNSIALNTQNNIRLKINLSLMEGALKGAVGLDEGDLQDLVDLLQEALFSDTDEPILEALAATGLHITFHDSAYVEYGDP